ncbi:MAG: hypothetical protein E7385_01360 [Ruminococcaceae bacterium]|nr:hypothetical protein [Oscillospiraceae bacterium]
MKIIKALIICLVLSSLVFALTACNMEKCSEEILDPTVTPSATNNNTAAPQNTATPQTTDNVPENTDNVGENARNRDRIIKPTDFVEDIFDMTAMPGMSPAA